VPDKHIVRKIMYFNGCGERHTVFYKCSVYRRCVTKGLLMSLLLQPLPLLIYRKHQLEIVAFTLFVEI